MVFELLHFKRAHFSVDRHISVSTVAAEAAVISFPSSIPNNQASISFLSMLSTWMELLLLAFALPLIPIFSIEASPTNTSFEFQSCSFRNLTLLGDSYLRNGSIGLTRDTRVPSSSSGTALYNLPIMFLDTETNASASFSTKFSFSITNPDPASFGDGLTFFLSPDKLTLGSSGRYLGVFNSAGTVGNRSVIAVEFDTRRDDGVDESDDHVGFDVDGPASLQAVDLRGAGIDLRSGELVTAWIDYHQDQKLQVWVGHDSTNKPPSPVLSVNFDLSKNVQQFMYVGFSASTEGSTELHVIESWSFQSFVFPKQNLSSGKQSIPPPPSSNTSNTTPRRRKPGLGSAILGPITFAIIVIAICCIAYLKWLKTKTTRGVLATEIPKTPRRFSYRELYSATKGFHGSRVVGNGAFGMVYRAVDPRSGSTYAVKRSKHAQESKTEFMAELSIIASLRHKNLVHLEGWCAEKGELFLVYEFMPNGSLDKVLYPKSGALISSSLNWSQRYNLALGIASVLSYLHQECEQQVIHRDVKTSNIMLDSELNPRLGDFGLARLMNHDESPVSTLTAGTIGYLAPEYLQYGKATEKTDVFSYGVVVLEVCCGRRPIEGGDGREGNVVNLVDWVWGLYSEGRLVEAVDGRLAGRFDGKEAERLLLVGLSCANPDCLGRPSMRSVVQILSGDAEPVFVPLRKPLLVFGYDGALALRTVVSDLEDSWISSPLSEINK